jgi:hypothetical protein
LVKDRGWNLRKIYNEPRAQAVSLTIHELPVSAEFADGVFG